MSDQKVILLSLDRLSVSGKQWIINQWRSLNVEIWAERKYAEVMQKDTKTTMWDVNIVAHLNPRHGEIGDLKVNRDRPLGLQLFALHTGQPKVRPHHVFLPPLQRTEEAKQLLQLHVEAVSVYKAFRIKLFIQFDEFYSQVSASKVRRTHETGPPRGQSDSNLWDLASVLHI